MTISPPSIIAINHDDYHARHIGRTSDGRQFFLTTPFAPAHEGYDGAEFVALYLFDAEGNLLDARIDNLGPRAALDYDTSNQIYDQRLAELGRVTFGRIEIKPFSVERFGLQFGLIPLKPRKGEDEWTVVLLPGDYMAFYEPWDSGDYDT